MHRIQIVVVLALLAASCGDIDGEALLEAGDSTSETSEFTDPDDDAVTPPATDPPVTDPPTSDPPPDDPPTTDPPTTDPPPPDPGGPPGSFASPIPIGEVAELGGGWRLQVLDVIADGTRRVLAENSFNDPPPADQVFTLVNVAVGYFGTDDPQSWFALDVFGVTDSVELDDDCGVVPDEVPFSNLYSGGVFTGNVCFVSDGDLDVIDLVGQQSFTLDDEFVVFDLSGPGGATAMAPARGPQPGASATPGRLDPVPAGTSAQLGEAWSATIENGRIGTDLVLDENQFNDPPPPGHVFYVVDATLLFDGEGTGDPFDVNFFALGDANFVEFQSCGVVPNAFEFDQEVFAGGELEGTVCFVVAEDDVDNLVVVVNEVFDFESGDHYFSPT